MSRSTMDELVDQHAWLADAYHAKGDLLRAEAERTIEERLLKAEIAVDPKAMDLQDTWIALQRAMAALERQRGNTDAALARLERALNKAEEMAAYDPLNREWAKTVMRVEADIANTKQVHARKENSNAH